VFCVSTRLFSDIIRSYYRRDFTRFSWSSISCVFWLITILADSYFYRIMSFYCFTTDSNLFVVNSSSSPSSTECNFASFSSFACLKTYYCRNSFWMSKASLYSRHLYCFCIYLSTSSSLRRVSINLSSNNKHSSYFRLIYCLAKLRSSYSWPLVPWNT
jgi:hypothetical protein